MAKAYKCDRCGAFYDIPTSEQPNGFVWVKGCGLGNSIDLCADCCDKLSEWIEGERETLTEPKTAILGDAFLEEVENEQPATETLGKALAKAGEDFQSNMRKCFEGVAKVAQSDFDDVPEETGEVVTSKPDAPTRGNRGREITKDYLSGMKRKAIAEKYELAPKSVSNAIAYFKANHPEEYAEMVKSAKNR